MNPLAILHTNLFLPHIVRFPPSSDKISEHVERLQIYDFISEPN